jgi:F-type H+-transporting ATPase subunit epsilon
MEKGLELKIITPDRIVYDGTGISSVTIPTKEGVITVLPGHVPLIAPIKTGEAHLIKDGTTLGLAVSGGILEVRDGNTIIILAERGELAHDIDLSRAEDAYKRAQDAMRMEQNIADVDYARIQSAMEKELNRINVGKKWRK